MKKLLLSIFLFSIFSFGNAQRIVPAPVQETPVAITGCTIHVGNGLVIENGTVVFEKGKIIYAGPGGSTFAANAKIINATGKHLYPGLIAPNSNLGLNEIELVRATNDYSETGIYNPGVRSLIAYNTDSRVIPTIRSNGVLLVQATPVGGTISGTSSIVQLDAWNWEDAAYKTDDGIHLNWPGFFRFNFNESTNSASVGENENYEKQVIEVRQYFMQAKAYNNQKTHEEQNLNLSAMKGLFDGTKTLFVHCDYVREIINAISFARELSLKLVIVGGRDAYLCTDLLKESNVGVILGNVHSLPANDDQDVELPYETAGLLHQAGVNYCLSVGGYWQIRNLPFMAGTTAAYGISKEDALKSITLSTAKILGIDGLTGSIEAGKDANIIVSDGDLLDMKSSNIVYAFLQGRQINLDNAHKQLYEIYMEKYGLKK